MQPVVEEPLELRRSASGTRGRPRTGRRGRARRPAVSAPASGWPPTKRWSSPSAATTARLVEPTSVTTQSRGPRRSASRDQLGQRRRPARAQKHERRRRRRASASESAARVDRAAARRAALQRAGSRVVADDLGVEPARARPARSSRRSARRRGPRSFIASPALAARAPRASRVQRPRPVVLPVHARVGDRLAVDELLVGRSQVLAARDEERLQHHADDRAVAGGDLGGDRRAATSGWRSWSLPLLSCEASITTRSRQPAAAQLRERVRDRVGVVVGRAACRRAG